jgi:molybdopterin converting factor small subunit
MARVMLSPALRDRFTDGEDRFEIEAANVIVLVRTLDRRFPGLEEYAETETSIAVDGEIITNWTRPLTPTSEVLFIPRIGGG